MIPCKNCIVLAICQGIICDGKRKLAVCQDIAIHIDTHMKLPMKFKSLLTQENIDGLVFTLVERCSLLEQYVMDAKAGMQEEQYWNVRHFYNLNQGEYNAITEV